MDYSDSLEWFMLEYPRHKEMREYVTSLNRFYLASKQLWEIDFSEDGFRWINADDADGNTVSFRRIAIDGSELLVFVSFSGDYNRGVRAQVDGAVYENAFDSLGDGAYAGEYRATEEGTEMTETGEVKKVYRLLLDMPPMSAIVLRKKEGKGGASFRKGNLKQPNNK